jgi:uncharacterized protein YbaA (DUF1428 family)
MGKYIDICIQPIPKKHVANYRKTTKKIGEILIKYGALASHDYVGEDKNATSLTSSFAKSVKLKKGEVIVYAVAEFKSKKQREQIFKKMMKDPAMQKIMSTLPPMDDARSIIGGFDHLVTVN